MDVIARIYSWRHDGLFDWINVSVRKGLQLMVRHVLRHDQQLYINLYKQFCTFTQTLICR